MRIQRQLRQEPHTGAETDPRVNIDKETIAGAMGRPKLGMSGLWMVASQVLVTRPPEN